MVLEGELGEEESQSSWEGGRGGGGEDVGWVEEGRRGGEEVEREVDGRGGSEGLVMRELN